MKKAVLAVLGITALLVPFAVKTAAQQASKPATYITKEEVDAVNKTPGVDRTLRVVDIGHEHFSVGIIHRGATGAAARGGAGGGAAAAGGGRGAAGGGAAAGGGRGAAAAPVPCGVPAGMMTMSPVLTSLVTTSDPAIRPLQDGPFRVVVTSASGADFEPLTI